MLGNSSLRGSFFISTTIASEETTAADLCALGPTYCLAKIALFSSIFRIKGPINACKFAQTILVLLRMGGEGSAGGTGYII